MHTDWRRAAPTITAAALALLLIVWSLGFAPRGFFSGDSGAKFIQAHDLAAQGFATRALVTSPLDPEHRWYRAGENFERPVGGARQGTYSIAFVAPTAALLGAFGIGSILILPALGAALALLALAWLCRRLELHPAAAIGALVVTAVGTPLAFYGAQLAEHAPATALVTCALAAVIARRPALAGAAAAGAAILRPECYCALTALGLALVAEPHVSRRAHVASALRFAAAAAPILLGYWTINLLTAGAADPLVAFNHKSTSTASAMTMLWGELRSTAPGAWLWFGAALAAAAAGLVAPAARRARLATQLALAALFVTLAWHAQHHSRARTLAGLFSMTPIVALGLGAGPRTRRARAPWLFACAYLAQVVLLERGGNGGGLQHGARFFLPAVPALIALAACAAEDAVRAAPGHARRALALAPAVALLVLTARGEHQGLRSALRITRRGAQAVTAALAGPGTIIVTKFDWQAGVLSPALLHGRDLIISGDADDTPLFRRIVASGANGFVYTTKRAVPARVDGATLRVTPTVDSEHDLMPLQYVSVQRR